MRGLYAKDGLMLSRHGEAGVDPAAKSCRQSPGTFLS